MLLTSVVLSNESKHLKELTFDLLFWLKRSALISIDQFSQISLLVVNTAVCYRHLEAAVTRHHKVPDEVSRLSGQKLHRSCLDLVLTSISRNQITSRHQAHLFTPGINTSPSARQVAAWAWTSLPTQIHKYTST